jgi:hypothetical protein
MEGFKWLVFIPIGDGLYAMVSDSDFIFLKKIFISQVHSDYDKSLLKRIYLHSSLAPPTYHKVLKATRHP